MMIKNMIAFAALIIVFDMCSMEKKDKSKPDTGFNKQGTPVQESFFQSLNFDEQDNQKQENLDSSKQPEYVKTRPRAVSFENDLTDELKTVDETPSVVAFRKDQQEWSNAAKQAHYKWLTEKQKREKSKKIPSGKTPEKSQFKRKFSPNKVPLQETIMQGNKQAPADSFGESMGIQGQQ